MCIEALHTKLMFRNLFQKWFRGKWGRPDAWKCLQLDSAGVKRVSRQTTKTTNRRRSGECKRDRYRDSVWWRMKPACHKKPQQRLYRHNLLTPAHCKCEKWGENVAPWLAKPSELTPQNQWERVRVINTGRVESAAFIPLVLAYT